jgi:hypothetical protein
MPLPALAAAAPILQGVGGLVQSIFGGSRARRAERALENLKTPTYEKSQAIGDYYSKALNRYNSNPYNSNMYQQQQRNIQRGLSAGIGALQNRRSAIGGISRLVQAQNDASLNAASAAEGQQAQAFGQLGQASQMQAGEERQAFNINKMLPYEKQYSLLAQKAAGGNQMMNAGLSNLFGGASTIGQMKFDDYLMGKYYGSGKQAV